MIQPRIIKTEDQYLIYLREIENLMLRGDKLPKDELDRLELLSVIVNNYESSKYNVDPIDPIEAIKFRLQERGLRQADLIPYLGTSGRVSEVLSRKRPLTVQMIRALSAGLGLSADTLIGSDTPQSAALPTIDWKKFPIREMVERGWLSILDKGSLKDPSRLVSQFIEASGLQLDATSFRRTLVGNAKTPTTVYALYAWLAQVVQKSRQNRALLGRFDLDSIDAEFLKKLARLSWSDLGPKLAIEYLQKSGISVVIEPQLKGTQLDGAALKDVDGTPIIALTLRFDRLDSFWFTLMHEVAHVWKHLGGADDTFVDDTNHVSDEQREVEANRIATEAFIPRLVWRRSDAYLSPNKNTIEALARELGIHPSIIAGRVRLERGNFSLLSDMVGQNEVRRHLVNTPSRS